MFLGIDIGATNGRLSVFSDPESAVEIDRIEFKMSKPGPGAFGKDIQELLFAAGRLASRHGQPEGLGVALAGKVNADRTGLRAAGNITHWVGKDVVGLLSKQLGCRVVLGNDAEAAGLAEAYYGHGQDSDFWFIIWGSGLGGALVRRINGVPYVFPGEPGHQVLDIDDQKPCGCGQIGCVELHTGGNRLAEKYGVPAEQLSPGEWSDVLYWISLGLQNTLAVQSAPLVVFGGGVANRQPQMLPRIHAQLTHDLHAADVPELKLSAFGESAGSVGALAFLRDQ
jgi:glucokinase